MRVLSVFALIFACSSNHTGGNPTDGPSGTDGMPTDGRAGSGGSGTPTTGIVFVIPMENESSSAIYGNTNATYINMTLKPESAWASMFMDELPAIDPSEPHYVWMEAGTNAFTDHTFTSDADASGSNSTKDTAHLVTQLDAAHIGWTSYQEGMTAGTCPIASIGSAFYAAKHDPFVFYQDVAGSPPSGSNSLCAAHHKPYSDFVADLMAGALPPFVFITPDLCHDMHGDANCPTGTNATMNIAAGDMWLSTELPRILDYATAHDGVVYIIWDEGSTNQTIPFLALGPHVKAGSAATPFTHSSQLRSIEEQLGVPVLPRVQTAADFSSMFQAGYFP
jgi:phosphatidylinositol-3-phosphatase